MSSNSTIKNNSVPELFLQKFNNLNWFNYEDPKNHFVDIPSSNSSVNILESEIYLKGQKDIDKFKPDDNIYELYLNELVKPPCQSGFGSPITPSNWSCSGKPNSSKTIDPSSFRSVLDPHKTPNG